MKERRRGERRKMGFLRFFPRLDTSDFEKEKERKEGS